MIIHDAEFEEVDGGEEVAMQVVEMVDEEDVEESFEQVAELALNLMVGLGSPKTLKVKGLIGSWEVVVLIDSCATHNFIALALA